MDVHSLVHHDPYELEFGGIRIFVHDNVFTPDPALTKSSSIVLDALPDVRGRDVLDLGTGTGVLAVIAALRGAKCVLAVDISDEALENARANVQLHKVEGIVHVARHDMRQPVEGEYDIVLANVPILDELWGDNTLVLLQQMLSNLRLRNGGLLCFAWASFGAPVEHVEKLLKEGGYTYTRSDTVGSDIVWYSFLCSKHV